MAKDNKIAVWMRLGVRVKLTEDEVSRLLADPDFADTQVLEDAIMESGVTAIGNSYIPAGCIEGREEEDEIELGDFLCSGIEFVPIRRKGGADGC